MDDSLRTIRQATPVVADDRQSTSLWSAVAPPIAWWWISLAGAAAIIFGLGFLTMVALFARPLAYFVLGIAIAAALAPPVHWLNRWMPRGLAVILVYVLLFAFFGMLGWMVFPAFVEQVQAFANYVPDQLKNLQRMLDEQELVDGDLLADPILSGISAIGTWLLTVPLAIVDSVVNFVVVLFLSLYALLAAPRVQRFAISFVPSGQRANAEQVLENVTNAMGGYVRGVAIGGVLVAVITYAALTLMGVNYPLLLAVLAGILEIIPILGPFISGTVIILVAFLQSPELALLALVFVLILQQIEGNILTPNIMSRQAKISPMLSLLAIVAGHVVGGLLGVLVAIPLVAAFSVLTVEVIAPMVRRWTGADPPKTELPPPSEIEET
jgi:predicted PurR-regulated permease PerM